jgi:hypothetical protein
VDLAAVFASMAPLERSVVEALRGYGQEPPEVGLFGFALGNQGDGAMFRFERRIGGGSDLYYAFAPLTTGDHLRILEQLAAILNLR